MRTFQVFLTVLALVSMSSPVGYGQVIPPDPCQTCVPKSIPEYYAESTLVLEVETLAFPDERAPEGRYRVWRTIKAKDGKRVPQEFRLQAQFGACKRGLFLPPGERFVVFLNQGDSVGLLPCRAPELRVEGSKIRLQGQDIPLNALAGWLEQRVPKDSPRAQESAPFNDLPTPDFCVEDADCTTKHLECRVPRCRCPSAVNRMWIPACGEQVEFFDSPGQQGMCPPCPAQKTKCLRNKCVLVRG